MPTTRSAAPDLAAVIAATAARHGLTAADLIGRDRGQDDFGRRLAAARIEAVAGCASAGGTKRGIAAAMRRSIHFVRQALAAYIQQAGRLPGAVMPGGQAQAQHLPLAPVSAVLNELAAVFGVTVATLKAPSRATLSAHPRQVAMAVLCDLGGLSHRRIATVFDLDPSTVTHGVARGRQMLQARPEILAHCRRARAQSLPSVRSAS